MYTDLGTVNITLYGICYKLYVKQLGKELCKISGKRAENSMESRAFIKAGSLLCLNPVDIHHEVCGIYGEGQMSHRSICRWVANFTAGQQDLKNAALFKASSNNYYKSNIKKIADLFNQDARYTERDIA